MVRAGLLPFRTSRTVSQQHRLEMRSGSLKDGTNQAEMVSEIAASVFRQESVYMAGSLDMRIRASNEIVYDAVLSL